MNATINTTIRLAALAVLLAAAMVAGLVAGGAISDRDESAAGTPRGMTHGNVRHANVGNDADYVDFGVRHLKVTTPADESYQDYGLRHAAPASSPDGRVPTQTLR